VNASPQLRRFTAEELSHFDGREGRPCYIAYKGKVYEIKDSPLWQKGLHQDEHQAGHDLTAELADAPHGEENLASFTGVGELLP
jgi:predicted heme/steroid binding protein